MSTDVKIDDKALAVIANRFKANPQTEVKKIIEKALVGKSLTNAERNALINHIDNRQFGVKPMSMFEMKKEIMAKIGVVVEERKSNSYYTTSTPQGGLSRNELEIIYNFVVKGIKPNEKKREQEQTD